MQRAKKFFVLFISVYMACPYIYGLPPKPIPVPDSGLYHVTANQPVPRGQAPPILGAQAPTGSSFSPTWSTWSSTPRVSDNQRLPNSLPFHWDATHPPSAAEIEAARYQATQDGMGRYYVANPDKCVLL